MNTKEKIELASNLSYTIEQIKSFIRLAERAQEVDIKNEKINEFKGINSFRDLTISTYISTGSASPPHSGELSGDEIIKQFVNAGLVPLREMLKNKEKQLNNLFK